jgi:hypothetical protein
MAGSISPPDVEAAELWSGGGSMIKVLKGR